MYSMRVPQSCLCLINVLEYSPYAVTTQIRNANSAKYRAPNSTVSRDSIYVPRLDGLIQIYHRSRTTSAGQPQFAFLDHVQCCSFYGTNYESPHAVRTVPQAQESDRPEVRSELEAWSSRRHSRAQTFVERTTTQYLQSWSG